MGDTGQGCFLLLGVLFLIVFEWEVCVYPKMMEFQKPHHPYFLELRKTSPKNDTQTPESCEFWSINRSTNNLAMMPLSIGFWLFLYSFLFGNCRWVLSWFLFRGKIFALTLCQIGSPVQKAWILGWHTFSETLLMRENTQTRGISIIPKYWILHPHHPKAPEKRLTKGPPKREGTSPKRVSLDATVCQFWEGVWD